MRHARILRVPTALAVLGFGAACADVAEENPTEPIIPDAPQLNPEILSASWRFDVSLTEGEIWTTKPTVGRLDGLSQSIIADHFGIEPGSPELSILGGDVVELTPLNLDFGPPRALPGVGSGFVRDVIWGLEVRNLISGVELIAPTFPAPPAGTSNPVLIPFNQVTTVTSGGINCEVGATTFTSDCFVEAPSEGNVFVSDNPGVGVGGAAVNDGYQGPPHNFFNDTPCEAAGTYYGEGDQSDCRPFRELPSSVPGGATVGPVTVHYTIDQTVNQFRTEILLAADLIDGTPDTQAPTFGAITDDGPARIGNDVTITASATDDRTAASLISFAFDLDNDGTFETPGNPAAFTCAAAGTFTVGIEATDGAGNAATTTTTVDCVANALPVADAGGPYSTPVNTTVTLDASASTDDVGIAAYDWDLDNDGTFETPGVSVGYTCGPTTGTFTVGLQVTDTPEGATSTTTTTVDCTPPANVFLVWTDGAGNEITSTTAGSTVTLQICTTEEATQAFQTNVSYSSLLTQVDAGADLNSTTAGVGACANAGGSDVVDQYTGGALGDPFNFQNFSIAASQGTGVVGLSEITFTADAAGSASASLALQVWSLFGGAPAPALIPQASTLTIN